jgi:hypothetical protein
MEFVSNNTMAAIGLLLWALGTGHCRVTVSAKQSQDQTQKTKRVTKPTDFDN